MTFKEREMIKQHIHQTRNGQKQRVGVLVGRLVDGKYVNIGWSRVNVNAGDKFNPQYGFELALERTLAQEPVPMPPSMLQDAHRFQDRCHRYFKDAHGISQLAIQAVKTEDEK